jgi:hypothetical protein
MPLTIEVGRSIPAPIPAVRAYLGDITNLVDFTGYGPIPGIGSAAWERGDGAMAGDVRKVINTDGSSHREEVVRVEARVIEDRIYDFDSPLRHLVAEIRDRFELSEADGGTRLERRFEIHLRSPLAAPLAYLIAALFLRPALMRHHDRLAERLTQTVRA